MKHQHKALQAKINAINDSVLSKTISLERYYALKADLLEAVEASALAIFANMFVV